MNQSPSIIDFKSDTEIFELQTSSLQLQPLPLPTSDLTLLCDTSTGVPGPYVPQQFQQTVFDLAFFQMHHFTFAHSLINEVLRLSGSPFVVDTASP